MASSVENTEKFHVIWTTPRLLQRQLQSDQLQVDSTYKTIWHEYPVIIVGHSNLDHQFQPKMLALGISEDQFAYGAVFSSLSGLGYDPREVLGDGSGAITAATKTHFPRALRVMCFAHVIRRFDKHSVGLPDDVRVRLRSDFCMLQYARNPIEYNRMATSMIDGWKGFCDSAVDKFAEYVSKTFPFQVFVVSVASSGKYYVCTCPEGSKKKPCKHAAMIMCSLTDLYEYPADVTAQPMKTNRKSKVKGGRRPLAESNHRRAAAD